MKHNIIKSKMGFGYLLKSALCLVLYIFCTGIIKADYPLKMNMKISSFLTTCPEDTETLTTCSIEEIHVSICEHESYYFGGTSLNTEGTYFEVVELGNGEHDLIILHLAVFANTESTKYKTICEGENVSFNGQKITTSGTYVEESKNDDGCVHKDILVLEIIPIIRRTIDAHICEGETYYSEIGEKFSKEGTYEYQYKNKSGCLTEVILNLFIHYPQKINLEETICYGETYFFDGKELSDSGEYKSETLSEHGCTVMTYLYLKVDKDKECQNFESGGKIKYTGPAIENFPTNGGVLLTFESIESPSGGSCGAIEYQWQHKGSAGWEDVGYPAAAPDYGKHPDYQHGGLKTPLCFRRAARRDCQSEWVYSNSVCVKQKCFNVTDAGTIKYTKDKLETSEKSFNPALIKGNKVTSGSGSEIEYQWQEQVVGGEWKDISGTNTVHYDPAIIKETTCFRRGVKRACASEWFYTTPICFYVYGCQNITSAGAIQYTGQTDYPMKTSVNIGILLSSELPKGGLGGNIEFKWQKQQTVDDIIDDGLWVNIENSNSPNYTPNQKINQTTCYRRAARMDCLDTWLYTETICITVCKNVTDVGALSIPNIYAETPFENSAYQIYYVEAGVDPGILNNKRSANGGSGSPVEYIWQQQINGYWANIVGEYSDSYDIPIIDKTSYFRRGARQGCAIEWEYTEPTVIAVAMDDCKEYTKPGTLGIEWPTGVVEYKDGHTIEANAYYNMPNIVNVTPPSGESGIATGPNITTRVIYEKYDYGGNKIYNSPQFVYNEESYDLPPRYLLPHENEAKEIIRIKQHYNWCFSPEEHNHFLRSEEIVLVLYNCDTNSPVNESIESAGTISSDNNIFVFDGVFCFDDILRGEETPVTSPSGLFLDYIWQKNINGSNEWINIENSNNANYNIDEYCFDSANNSVCFRRGVKLICDNEYLFSNEMCYEMTCEDMEYGGSIKYTGDKESVNGELYISKIENSQLPLGGSQPYEYAWIVQIFSTHPSINIHFPAIIPEANGESLIFNESIYPLVGYPAEYCFTRLATNTCSKEYEKSNSICFFVGDCSALEDAGKITYDGITQTAFNNFYFGETFIEEETPPSGGLGDVIEYQWQKQELGAIWKDIKGANSPTYKPIDAISRYTCYRRGVKRDCQSNWLYSNVVCFEVNQLDCIDLVNECSANLVEITKSVFDQEETYCKQWAGACNTTDGIYKDKNVNIGAAPAHYLELTGNAHFALAVTDGVITNSAVINGTFSFPDYVFEENYNLMPLHEVEEYIESYKHLPGVKSAKEIESTGHFSVKETILSQQEKIEEIYLHLINLKQRNKDLKQKLESKGICLEELSDINSTQKEIIKIQEESPSLQGLIPIFETPQFKEDFSTSSNGDCHEVFEFCEEEVRDLISANIDQIKCKQWLVPSSNFSECEESAPMYRRGKVGIGTSIVPNGYSLGVYDEGSNQAILAGDVFVKLRGNWPDYVFADNYVLMSLLNIEQFINNNGHLPDFLCEEALIEEGLEVKNILLLQQEKIEELFLHLIKQNKSIQNLENR